jgi:hypothetical protein
VKKRSLVPVACLAGMAILLILSGCPALVGEASNDATLKSLKTSAGTLTPAFNANTTEYTVAVGNDVASLTVTGEANHAAAVLGPATGVVTKNLSVGSANVFAITVTAEDGTTAKTYTVTVTRAAEGAKSNDASLKALVATPGTLSPAFSAATTEYTIAVGNDVASLTVTGEANHAAAVLDPANGVVTKDLSSGSGNVFTITVTAEDGSTTKTYTVTVTRSKSSDATLKSLVASPGTLEPAFSAETTEYTVDVIYTVTSLTVTGQASNTAAVLDPANGVVTKDLSVGDTNTFTITVSSEDGTATKTYTVTVTRGPNQGIGSIVLNPPDFSDPAAGALPDDLITLYKDGTGGDDGGEVTLTVTGTYDSYTWLVDGAERGTTNTLLLRAADYSVGDHFLTLEVVKDTVLYSKEITVTVAASH